MNRIKCNFSPFSLDKLNIYVYKYICEYIYEIQFSVKKSNIKGINRFQIKPFGKYS